MHNIEYFTFKRDVNKERVEKELNEYVAHEDWQEGCCGLYHSIRWIDGKVYLSRDCAEEAIRKMDHGDYDQLAVLFEHRESPKNDREKELRDKVADNFKEYRKRDSVLYADTVTSSLITCKGCGSKLSRTHIKTNQCPVCHAELRPDHMLKSVDVANKRWKKSQKDLDDYIMRKGKKEVMWLVKIEYHT